MVLLPRFKHIAQWYNHAMPQEDAAAPAEGGTEKILPLVILAAVIFLVYANSLAGSFLWDDQQTD